MSTDRDLIHPRDAIMRTMERIYRYRMTTTSGGNLSIRDDDGSIWITPARLDKGSLRREDIVRVRPDGTADGPAPALVGVPVPPGDLRRQARPPRRSSTPIPVALVAFSICRQVPDTRLLHQARHVCGPVGLRPLCPARQRGAGPEHRGDVRRGFRLRGAREPRRRDRRGEPAGRLRAVRDAGVHRQDGHQGRACSGEVRYLDDEEADQLGPAADSPPRRRGRVRRDQPRRRSCAGSSASSSAAATSSGS